jgi:hypothetical protein
MSKIKYGEKRRRIGEKIVRNGTRRLIMIERQREKRKKESSGVQYS